MSAQNFLESAQNLILECKTKKKALFHVFGTICQRFFSSYIPCFMAILVHNSAQNYIKQNSDRAKEFTFRMSGLVHIDQA